MKILVIGSGPSGANAALTLLRRGAAVELWDVGREEPPFPEPTATFEELKSRLPDPQAYFLGKSFEALLPPDGGELLEYPPSRGILLNRSDPLWPYLGSEFNPVLSLMTGGLASGWGANAVSFDDDDMWDWPVGFSDYASAYAEAYERIPVAGPAEDDLSAFFPGVRVTQPPIALNEHDEALLRSYVCARKGIQKRFGLSLGVARLAVANDGRGDSSCEYCGRCLWGCPRGSIYNPAMSTLAECMSHRHFTYERNRLVVRLETSAGRVTHCRYRDLASGNESAAPFDSVFLAAGALQSGAIFLRTVARGERAPSGKSVPDRTRSVLDTAVVKIPYVQLRRLGKGEMKDQFQFNRLIMAYRHQREGWPSHVHGEILSLNTLLYHPLIEHIPFGSRIALRVFFQLKPALGVVTLFFPDRMRTGNGLSLEPAADSPTGDRARIHYRDSEGKADLIAETIKRIRRALLALGCIPSAPIRMQPGAGIHYAGTIPMGEGPLCSDRNGRANAFANLYIADGAAFPSLPSKSITLSLIAHSIRVATLASI